MGKPRLLWAVQWRSQNRCDGYREYFMNENCLPVLFLSRRAAREWVKANCGYISKRPDLRSEPHGWRTPRAVRVYLEMAEAA